VVNVCSVAGFISGQANSAYNVSKYALKLLSDCLRCEMSILGLCVSITELGIMRTPIIEKHGQALEDSVMQLSIDI
jgi:NAD(P)-dependent dehydrogenase (short-subunit alcohol dehydrogenase family)